MSLLAAACVATVPARYAKEWGPEPAGPPDACPDLSGTYANAGEPGPPGCVWSIIPPIPFPLGCDQEGSGRFHRARADAVRIEMDDSDSVRITLLDGDRVVKEQTLSREGDDFECDEGRVIYRVGELSWEHSLHFELARALDGSLLLKWTQHEGTTGMAAYSHTYSGWSRHPEFTNEVAERLKLEERSRIGVLSIHEEPLPDDAEAVWLELLEETQESSTRITGIDVTKVRCSFEVDPASITNVGRFEEALAAHPRITHWSGPPESPSYRIEVKAYFEE